MEHLYEYFKGSSHGWMGCMDDHVIMICKIRDHWIVRNKLTLEIKLICGNTIFIYIIIFTVQWYKR